VFFEPQQPGEYETMLHIYSDDFDQPDARVWLTGTALSAPEVMPPASFKLSPPYPNPFNSTTSLKYEIPEPGRLSFTIYDAAGRMVYKELLNPQGGRFNWSWKGKNEYGIPVTSGLYFCQVEYSATSGLQNNSMLKLVVLR